MFSYQCRCPTACVCGYVITVSLFQCNTIQYNTIKYTIVFVRENGRRLCVSCSNFLILTSSNGSFIRVTGPLCGEFTVTGLFPSQKASDADFDVSFMWVCISCLTKSPMTGDLRLHDVIVICGRFGCLFCCENADAAGTYHESGALLWCHTQSSPLQKNSTCQDRFATAKGNTDCWTNGRLKREEFTPIVVSAIAKIHYVLRYNIRKTNRDWWLTLAIYKVYYMELPTCRNYFLKDV